MFFSDCEQAELVADFAEFLSQPCTIERRGTPTKDAYGGSSAAYTQVKTVCRVLPLKSPRETVQGAQVASTATQQILLPLATQVCAKDRLVTGGVRFELTATDAGKTDAFFLTVDAVKAPQ